MPLATASSNGQVVIPRAIRDASGIQAGDKLDFSIHDDHVHISRPGDPLEAFRADPKMPPDAGQVEALLKQRLRPRLHLRSRRRRIRGGKGPGRAARRHGPASLHIGIDMG